MDLAPLQFPSVKAASAPARDARAVEAAAREFEGMMIGQMLEPMFAGLKTDGMFGGGTGETVFRSLLVQEFGKSLAASGGLGLADDVMRSMLRMQEG
jgi:Rod binding domain-containing protein